MRNSLNDKRGLAQPSPSLNVVNPCVYDGRYLSSFVTVSRNSVTRPTPGQYTVAYFYMFIEPTAKKLLQCIGIHVPILCVENWLYM